MKKLIAKMGMFVLVLGMLGGAASAATFTDVPETNWAYGSIQNMSEKGIMKGTGAGTFNPNGTITRAEFIAVVTRALIPDKLDASVKDTWYAANYKAAMEAKLIQDNEMPNTAQEMSVPITRYEMARVLVRADENINVNGEVAVDTSAIKDYGDIPVKYSTFVAQAYAKGLLTGYSDGMFNGEHNMSRAQAAVVMERLLKAKGETGTKPEETVPEENSPYLEYVDPNRPAVLPEPGEYTEAYQTLLDECGETIVTKTVRFKMVDEETGAPIPNTLMEVWRTDWNSDDVALATTIRSDANGEGSFTLDMPKSFYDNTMRGVDGTLMCDEFDVFGFEQSNGNNINATIDGVNYVTTGERLTYHYLRDNPSVMEIQFLGGRY